MLLYMTHDLIQEHEYGDIESGRVLSLNLRGLSSMLRSESG